MPIADDRRSSEADVVSTLAARVEAIDSLLRTTSEVVDEKTLKELRRTIESLAKRDPKFEERVTNKVDVMADRVATLAKTVSTSSAAVVAKQGEMVQLRRELEAGLARVDSAAARLGNGADAAELAEMKRALADLSQLTKQKLPRGLESRVDELAAKLTLLGQRVDSVSTTVSTAASGLAGRDGDVIALRRAVESDRDRVAAELAELRRAVDPTPVDELRQALKAHADETTRRLQATRQLVSQTGAGVDALAGRLDTLTATVTSATARVSDTEDGLAAFRSYFESAGGQLSAHLAEHQRSLAALSARAVALEEADEAAARVLDERVAGVARTADGLAGRLDSFSDALTETESRISGHEEGVSTLRAYVDDAGRRLSSLLADQKQSLVALDERAAALERADDEVVGLSQRLDSLADSVESATSSLGEKERALTSLHRHFTESSTRIESIVDDIRVALSAVPDVGPTTINDLGAYVERIHNDVSSLGGRIDQLESAARETTDGRDRSVGEIAGRIDLIDQRVAAVAAEVARTKTLWPVALRSLEARLDDAVAHRHHTESELGVQAPSVAADADEHSDDLLAGLRDSLHAMETVAAEMARASDALNGPDDETQAPEPNAPVAAAGATVVPLRTGER